MANIVELIQGLKVQYLDTCNNISLLNSQIREIEKIKRDTKNKVPAKFRKTYSTEPYDRYITELKRDRAYQEILKRRIELKIDTLAEFFNRFV